MKTQKLVWIFLAILISANLIFQFWWRAPKAPTGEIWTAITVFDGQTIAAKSPSGAIQSIQLLGIAAPALEPWQNLAKQRLAQLVKNLPIILEFESAPLNLEAEMPLAAYLWQGNTLVNAQMIKEGYVLTNFNYKNRLQMLKFQGLESEARLLELGIWNPQNPLRSDPRARRFRSNSF